MTRKLLISFLLLFCFNIPLHAQKDSQLSGKVKAGESNEALPGVTIQVKGTTVGTITDEGGSFKISVPSNAATLVFSAIGMQTAEEQISDRNIINISLGANPEELNEVIITALGIKGERDKFASSVSTLEGKSIARSGETSLLTGLSGKTSGVLITRNGGNPGAGAYIQIRGQKHD